jgi:peptidoglycan/LPS O-acetylase OafA/YrhL
MGSFFDLVRFGPRRVAWPVQPGAFRLFLAMLVFVHHFSSLGFGPYAVYVFFVLSGFWVQTMWTQRYAKTRDPYLTYMVSRVWRLAPVMALVSLIAVVLLPAAGVPREQVFSANPLHLLFSSVALLGYSWLSYGPVGSAWSLDVEMQFYIVAPLLASLVASTWGRRGLLLAAALCSIVFALVVETPILPKYILFFVVGMAAARTRWQPSGRSATLSAIVFGVLVIGLALTPWRDILIGGANPSARHLQWNPLYNVVLGVSSIPFAIYTTRQPSDAPDRMMADLSYIIYLLHWVAMQWFFRVEGPFIARLEFAGLSFAVVPTAAWAIWRYYDKPLNVARARWVSSRTQAAVATVAAEPAIP